MRATEAVARAADRGHADEVVGAREERGEGGRERPPAEHLHPDRGRHHLLLGDVHLEVPLGMRLGEDVGEGRVRDLAVERDHVATRGAHRGERVAVRLARRDLLAEVVARQLERAGGVELVPHGARVGLLHLDLDVPVAAELLDDLVRVVERLAVPPVLVLDLLRALALDRAGHDDDGLPGRRERLRVRAVDRLDVVAVDLDRVPAEGARPVRVRVEVPAVHRLAALAEPVDVDDRDEVVELVVRAVLERLPLRALGDLAVAEEHPDAERKPVELLPGERHADAVRQALAEGAGGDVDPGDPRRRMPLEHAPELPVGREVLDGESARGAVHPVEERGRVPFREDQPVVVRVLRPVEVVPQVLGEQHRHQVGGGHARGGVARLRIGGAADRVDP